MLSIGQENYSSGKQNISKQIIIALGKYFFHTKRLTDKDKLLHAFVTPLVSASHQPCDFSNNHDSS